MDRITKFPLLDETGQEIASSLEKINNSMGDYIASNNPYYAYLEDRKIGTLVSTEITKVRDYGLYDRKSLIAIDLPKCVSVGEDAFSYTALSSVNLPECQTINSLAFTACEKLKQFTAPKVTKIKNSVFSGCKSLLSVELPECTNVGESAFEDCTALSNVNLPKCITIGEYAFSSCEKLQNVNIPKCMIIKNAAFQYCNLKKIDLNVVEKIEAYAFSHCELLDCVKILNTETICVLVDKIAFNSTPIANGTGYIYVPDALVNDYKKATNWSVYANQIKPLSEYVESEE